MVFCCLMITKNKGDDVNLMAKVRKHENEDLHEKVISLVSLISH